MITATRTYHKHYTSTQFLMPNGDTRHFLELPWRDNEIGKSCIPEGAYLVDRDHTGRMQYYALRNEQTEPRTAIEIHPATRLKHLQGCLAPCKEIKGGPHTSDPIAIGSSETMKELLEWFGESTWYLRIRSV